MILWCIVCFRISQLLAAATTLCSQESSSIGLPDFPVDNLLPALQVLVRALVYIMHNVLFCWGKSHIFRHFIYLFATEQFPSDVVPAAGTKALPLQQHAEQGRVHGCGGCPQCEIQLKKTLKMFFRKLIRMGAFLVWFIKASLFVEVWAHGWTPYSSPQLNFECWLIKRSWGPCRCHIACCRQRYHLSGICHHCIAVMLLKNKVESCWP